MIPIHNLTEFTYSRWVVYVQILWVPISALPALLVKAHILH